MVTGKRVFSLLLAALIAFSAVALPGFADDGLIESNVINMTLEDATVTSGVVNEFSAAGVVWMNTGISQFIITDVEPISGAKSLIIQRCDMRWWNLGMTNPLFGFEFKFNIKELGGDGLVFCVTSQDGSTGSEGTGGRILSIANSGASIVMADRGGNKVADLSKDTTYKVTLILKRRTANYDIYLDDVLVKEDAVFASPVYGVSAARLNVNNSIPGGTSIKIDDFRIFGKGGKVWPQQYSTQATGPLPVVTLPPIDDSTDVAVFINGDKVAYDQPPVVQKDTVMVPIKKTLEELGAVVDWNAAAGTLAATKAGFSMALKAGTASADVNGNSIKLASAPILVNGAMLVPYSLVSYIAKALDVKAWWDGPGNMVAITTGAWKDDMILHNVNGRLYRNGKPYYEISFNKFDLLWQLAYDHGLQMGEYANVADRRAGAVEALTYLRDNGFKTIRVFTSITYVSKDLYVDAGLKAKFYAANDEMYDLCDQYGIQVVACLQLTTDQLLAKEYVPGYGWADKGESVMELITDPDSESRQNVYKYIEEYVGRYKDRKSVIMWEIVNEGNLEADIGTQINRLCYSSIQLGEFYESCARKIHEVDPVRLVTTGDSCLRPAQWNLLKGILEGDPLPNWTFDTREERLKILQILNRGVDVISAHCYDLGRPNTEARYTDDEGKMAFMTFKDHIDEAKRFKKPFYNGETFTAPMPEDAGKYLANYNIDPNIYKVYEEYLGQMIDAGVQLTHWWAFCSNRGGGFQHDNDSWSIRPGVHDEAFRVIVEANQKIKAKYGVDGDTGPAPVLNLTTAAHIVKAGDYFTLNTAFDKRQDSNAAILSYTFDGGKFEYAGFAPASGVQVINTDFGAGYAKITAVSMEYDLKNFGDLMLRAKEDAVLSNEHNTVGVSLEYVALGEDGEKSIKALSASARFTTLGGSGGGPALPGDTNFDGVLDLIDLSNMIDWFGYNKRNADWETLYTFFDFNNNGIIDISDLAYVAQRI